MPTKVVLKYLIFGVLWIFITSAGTYYLMNEIGETPEWAYKIESYKGVLFVVVTAAFLYFILKRADKKQRSAYQQYKNLFDENPNPMWVYDLNSQKFLKVNQAAINKYGYSEEEFAAMTLRDIRPQSEWSKLEKAVKKDYDAKYKDNNIWLHQTRSGKLIFAHIVSHSTTFDSQAGRLVTAIDVSDRVIVEQQIMGKNQLLEEILWQQAHELRAPLANILGLLHLKEISNGNNNEDPEIFYKLKCSAIEMDKVIHRVVEKINSMEGEGYFEIRKREMLKEEKRA
jgi:PAS domain S-box-containing protein